LNVKRVKMAGIDRRRGVHRRPGPGRGLRALPGLLGTGMILLLGLAPGLAGQQSMTLDEAIQRALQRSPQMAQARQQLNNAGWSQRAALGAFLPSVSTNSAMSIRSANQLDPNTGELVAGSADSYSAGINANLNIFDGLSRWRERQGAGAEMDAAQASMVDQEYDVVLQTQTAFFQALRQDELVAVAQARVDQAGQSLELARTRANLRVATISDTLRARLELVNARQQLLQSEAAMRTARVNLGRRVGVEGPVLPVVPESLDPAPLSISEEDLLTEAVMQAPSVLAAEAQQASARASAQASRSSYFPSLSMSTGYNWNNQNASFAGGRTSWRWALSASLPIFNGFTREAQVARASESLRVAEVQARDARLGARAEATAALETHRTAQLAIAIAQEAVALAQEDLRVVRERYEQGVARIFDVVESQIALDQARVDLVGARFDYVIARAELEAIVGREL